MLLKELQKIFINDLDWGFAGHIAVKAFMMFIIILVFLRLTGKKGIRQLSIFEVAIIIALGSAAGDPMVDQEMAIIPSLIVFGCIVLFYRILTYFAARWPRFERLLEGDPIYIIEEGICSFDAKKEHTFAKDEFFAEMREAGAEHVGQIETAILESNGKMSIFFYPAEQTKYGLPILPKAYHKKSRLIEGMDYYACTNCANVIHTDQAQHCIRCQHNEWVKASKKTRS